MISHIEDYLIDKGIKPTNIAKIRKPTEAHYPEQIRLGYYFVYNCLDANVERIREKLTAKSLEVFVGDIAFGPNGIMTGVKAVFVKIPQRILSETKIDDLPLFK